MGNPLDEIDRADLTRLRDECRVAAVVDPYSSAARYARKLTGYLYALGALSAYPLATLVESAKIEVQWVMRGNDLRSAA
jgi:hypothetical protein